MYDKVGIMLQITFPETYPEEAPNVDISILKGLNNSQLKELQGMVAEQLEELLGAPMIFDLGEILKEWLIDNNTKGGVRRVLFDFLSSSRIYY